MSQQLLSQESPRIVYFPKFLSNREADELRSLGEPLLGESSVEHSAESDKSASRTSTSGWLTPQAMLGKDRGVLDAVRVRTRMATTLPFTHFEHLQVQRYEPGQLYKVREGSSEGPSWILTLITGLAVTSSACMTAILSVFLSLSCPVD